MQKTIHYSEIFFKKLGEKILKMSNIVLNRVSDSSKFTHLNYMI